MTLCLLVKQQSPSFSTITKYQSSTVKWPISAKHLRNCERLWEIVNNLNFRDLLKTLASHTKKRVLYSIYSTSAEIKNYLHRLIKDVIIFTKYFVKRYISPTAANVWWSFTFSSSSLVKKLRVWMYCPWKLGSHADWSPLSTEQTAQV